MQNPVQTTPHKPQSSRYLCLVEELEKSRTALYRIDDRISTAIGVLYDIRRLMERIVGDESIERESDIAHAGQAPFPPPPSEKPPEQAAQTTQTEAQLSVVEAGDDYSPGHPQAEDAPGVVRDEISQPESPEKARRIRHGEGLDLDEPQF